MRALCALAFILFAAAPTFVAAQSVSVDKSCYNVDSQGFVDIVITVQNDANPAPLDWIGIFPAGSSQMTDIGAWLFTCGDKFCMKAESQGMVPLKTSLVVGDWKAVLSRSNMPPYVPYAVSPTFTVSSACSAISSGTVTTNSQPAIQVGGDTFLAGQTIPISYQLHGSSSGIDEFIGIFPSSISSDQLLNEGLLWKLLCDRQGTNCPLFAISSEGTVNFSGSSATWHQTTDWPLQAGTYRAYMLKNNVEASFWPVIAQSNTFTIITTTPNINGQALTHLTNARSAIESLIRSDDTLAPKFLRMGFHDCIGGCDGTSP